MSEVLTPPITSAPQEQWIALQTGQIVVSAAISVPNASYLEYNVAEQVTGIVGGADGLMVFLLGTVSELDGGQGWFAWDSTNLTPSDGLTVFNPYPSNSTPGRWLLASVVLNVDEALAEKVHWVPYTTLGQSFATNDLTRDGEWTMIANKPTTTRPAPQESGPETDLLPAWTPATQNARASYTVLNQWTLSQAGWISQYGIDILAGNVGMVHAVTLTINGTAQDTFSITPTVAEMYLLAIAPILVGSGAVVRVTLTVTQSGGNPLVYWEQQTGLFATAPTYTSLAQGQKDAGALGTTAYGCHVTLVPGTASPDWDMVAYSGGAAVGGGGVGQYLPLTGGTVNPGPLIVSANTAALPAPLAGTLLQVGNADGTASQVGVVAFAANSAVALRRAGGTAASPTAVQSGNQIATVQALGYGATGWAANASCTMQCIASENFSDTAQGGYFQFNTITPGSTTPVGRMQVRQGVIVGNASTDPGQGGLTLNANTGVLPPAVAGTLLHVGNADAVAPVAQLDGFGAGAVPEVLGTHAMGTNAAKTATTAGVGLLNLYATGYDGSAYGAGTAASISLQSLNAWTTGDHSTQVVLGTTASGATASANRVTVRQGVVLGNTSSDPGQGGLVLNANAAALPAPAAGTQTLLQLGAADGNITHVELDGFGSAPQIRQRFAGGTNAAKTAVPLSHALGYLLADGYDGSAYGTGAFLLFESTEAWSPTAHGTHLVVETTANGTTSPAVNMTLDGSGNLTVTGAVSGTNFYNGNSVASSANTYGFSNTNGPSINMWGNTSGGAGAMQFNTGPTTNAMSLSSGGNLTILGATATKPGGGSWVAPSDRSLKSSVTDWPTGLAEILRLRPIAYQYNNDEWNLGHCDYVGLDAEDGADIIPEMSRTVTVPVGPAPHEGEPQPTTEAAALDHGPLIFALVNAVKELTARLEQLEGARR